MEFKQTQLDNGLVIIGEVTETARSLAMGFFVRTGSRDEWPEVAGVSHFLEHMMFKGTDKRSALEVNLEFDDMGAKYNAFTSEENTVYYAAVLPEYQQNILELWSDLMRPALREEDFNTEKGVICEEIAMYKDQPNFDVLDRCRKLHFGDHVCGNSVLGTVESIQALKANQMRNYFQKRYAADNILLVCSGKFDWDKLVDQAKELCGGWNGARTERELSDFRGSGKAEAVQKTQIMREHLCLMSPAPSAQSELRYAAGILANIVGDDSNSRLYWDLVDTAKADSADMECEVMDGTGAYYTYISCDPQQTDEVLETARKCLAKVDREGVTENELTASKNKIASTVTLNGELPMGRLVPLGFNWVYRREYRRLAEELERIKAVTRDDIRKLLKQYPLEAVTILGLGPCEKISS
ncbi:MAG: insulinase family protein [Sedimentisphaerales bacterium]|nr:insulinase family protein [Sedimentisphaerales bacterium]